VDFCNNFFIPMIRVMFLYTDRFEKLLESAVARRN
jgi:hypothetical protein